MRQIKSSLSTQIILSYIALQFLFILYSFSGIFTKIAAMSSFPSYRFVAFFALSITVMGGYAFFWQKVLKIIPLSKAYSNKAITIVWGLVWGKCFFDELVTVNKVIGAVLVIAGVVLYSFSDLSGENSNE